ncbi:hypothetical protein B0F90DRAFT_228310 [Multifurca ochricompacta]|uniref:Uncharacterized protein n=1 Tax=Multifurca ochricompacta TaxID=376703 RepID=A0AAD4LWB8_9AGAM|nr:hypothetical protein B0F90DRAFT_228310 [Multifurca ochricompacta]
MLNARAILHLVIHISFPNVRRYVRDVLKRLLDPHKPHFAIRVWIYDVDENSGQSMTSETPSQPRASPLYYASQFGLTCRKWINMARSDQSLSVWSYIRKITFARMTRMTW